LADTAKESRGRGVLVAADVSGFDVFSAGTRRAEPAGVFGRVVGWSDIPAGLLLAHPRRFARSQALVRSGPLERADEAGWWTCRLRGNGANYGHHRVRPNQLHLHLRPLVDVAVRAGLAAEQRVRARLPLPHPEGAGRGQGAAQSGRGARAEEWSNERFAEALLQTESPPATPTGASRGSRLLASRPDALQTSSFDELERGSRDPATIPSRSSSRTSSVGSTIAAPMSRLVSIASCTSS
jgi:hypothetical protein